MTRFVVFSTLHSWTRTRNAPGLGVAAAYRPTPRCCVASVFFSPPSLSFSLTFLSSWIPLRPQVTIDLFRKSSPPRSEKPTICPCGDETDDGRDSGEVGSRKYEWDPDVMRCDGCGTIAAARVSGCTPRDETCRPRCPRYFTGDNGTGIYGTCTSTGSWKESFAISRAPTDGKENKKTIEVVGAYAPRVTYVYMLRGTDKGELASRKVCAERTLVRRIWRCAQPTRIRKPREEVQRTLSRY
ncbi:hypothetical protein EDB92DRAFT_205790 [Lactarius akahatsu]|uniref:Uncharacterized protein n=1 Tax=Lactarius akahatsu TaxID=416441 RepID=A0AAD4QA04_9AGAM|nr:hypothetical protein EDB92DRAFT_205790 [Lactarius akahatsu]